MLRDGMKHLVGAWMKQVFMIPGEDAEAKVGRDRDFSLEVYQWCSLDYSCFEAWVIVCNALLNLFIGELCF
jgi:hypothetical protein